MDINDIRSIVTVSSFILFVVLVARTWGRGAAQAHDAASRLVFEGEPADIRRAQQEAHHG